MKTFHPSYPLKRFPPLAILPIATLIAAIAVLCLAAPGNAFPTGVTLPVTLLRTAALTSDTVDDYQPPDNGGPGKTGGSGTRWR